MRRMISENQAKGLEKLNNNIVISDDGTLVEVGGNIAVESIEQIGYIGQEPASCIVNPSNITTAGEATRLEGVQGTDLRGKTATIDASGTTHVPNDGDLYAAPVGGPPSIWYNIGGIVYKVAYSFEDPDHSIKVSGENLTVKTDPKHAVSDWTEGGDVFKPFFTEDQYQELLDLIA